MKTSSTASCRSTHFNAVVDHLQTLPNIEIIACGKRSAYTLNRYNDALKTVAAKYYHRLELVDDFNHLDDAILKFGLNVPDSLIPEIQPKLHAALGIWSPRWPPATAVLT